MDSWVTIDDGTPTIADYALLGNCQGSALVSRGGSIDWACLPCLDSPAFFARILGEPGGYWSITPRDAAEVTREYVEDQWGLRTSQTETGTVLLTDFMPIPTIATTTSGCTPLDTTRSCAPWSARTVTSSSTSRSRSGRSTG